MLDGLQWLTALPWWQAALALFALRVVALAVDAIDLVLIIRGEKLPAWVMAFVTSALFLVALSLVAYYGTTPPMLLAYGLGYATGTAVGMSLERRLVRGYLRLRIISRYRGRQLVEALRAAGFAVTEIPAQGRDGSVTLLHCGVDQRLLPRVLRLVEEVDPEAFVTAEAVRPLTHGLWRPIRPGERR